MVKFTCLTLKGASKEMLIREKVRDLMVAGIFYIEKKKRVQMDSREKNITQFEVLISNEMAPSSY